MPVLIFAFALISVAAPCDAGQRFLSALDDVPLMAGLEEVADEGMAYDKPEGRIVEAYAVGAVTMAAARDFYAAALPELGWRPAAGDAYARDDETLKLKFETRDVGIGIRFILAPRR